MKNVLVYSSFGKEEYLNHTLFSLISFFQKHNPFESNSRKVIVYTDNPIHFTSYLKEGSEFIEYQKRSAEEFKHWMISPNGKLKDQFRVKIKVLEEVLSKNSDSNVILLDSDTYFIKNIDFAFDQIQSGKIFMHKDEASLMHSLNYTVRLHRKYFKKACIMLGEFGVSPRSDLRIFNAGVLGMNTSKKHLVDRVLKLHDILYEKEPNHFCEQLLFGYILQTKEKVLTIDKEIAHWWYLKEFEATLNKFLERTKHLSFKELLATPLPTSQMPSYEEFKGWGFALPYKFKKKLFEKGLRKKPYIQFE